jgi:hypothetical protein
VTRAWPEALRGAIFDPLRPLLDALPADRWPTHDELTTLAQGVHTARGQPLRFVPPRPPDERERRYYELHIAETGEVQTRPENRHDLFNALVWIAFPRAKAMINDQHARILEERGEPEARRRSPERDALTLFDEGGVIVASSSPRVAELIHGFEWKELFWHRRAELQRTTRCFVFGHACYEQALDPDIGMVAKTVIVEVPGDFTLVTPPRQVAAADALLAEHFRDRVRFPSPKAMSPMPVLGVPGWHPATRDEAFYDDTAHFRSRGVRS